MFTCLMTKQSSNPGIISNSVQYFPVILRVSVWMKIFSGLWIRKADFMHTASKNLGESIIIIVDSKLLLIPYFRLF